MKRLFMLILTCLLFSAQLHSQLIKAAGVNYWFPIILENKGLAVDVLSLILPKMGLQCRIVTGISWNRILTQARTGDIDIVLGAYYTEERAKQYVYSDCFAEDRICIFVLKGKEFLFNSLADLMGKRGGRPMGGSYGQEFDDFARNYLTIDDSSTLKNQMFSKLERGLIDYAVYAEWDALAWLIETRQTDKFTMLPRPVTTNKVYFLVSQSSPLSARLPEFNEHLSQLHASGTLKQITDKYIAYLSNQ